jgi:mRNA degradation ribonuclease J1/J2
MEAQTQAKQAREQLASQGMLSVRPSSREKGIAAIGQRPKSASLGFGRKRKLTRRRKNRRVTRRKL